jgi:hypothetical protein
MSWIDKQVEPGLVYYYRLVAEDLDGNASKPSPAVMNRAYDLRPLAPPPAQAVWNSSTGVVNVNWNTDGLTPDLEVSLQRAEAGNDFWARIKGWTPAATGQARDLNPSRGSTYEYKLRVRNKSGRTSDNEPIIGPISIPEAR